MIGDNAKRLVIESEVNRTFNARMVVSATENRLPSAKKGVFDTSFFSTDGYYSIEYCNIKLSNRIKKQGDYLLFADVMQRTTTRIYGWDDIVERAKTDVRFKFIVEKTMLKPIYFEIAKNNPYTRIPFALKVEELYDILKKKSDGTEPVFAEKGRQEQEEARRSVQSKVRKEKKEVTGNWLQQ